MATTPADASAAATATANAHGSSAAARSAAATADATAAEPPQTAAAPSRMTALTPEIRWHCGPTGLNEAVLSIDFLHPQVPRSPSPSSAEQQQLEPTVLATGGADKEIKLWRVSPDLKDHTGLTFVFSLSGHDRSVNCVRFSPNGEFLASASDDATVMVWTKPKTAGADWSWDAIASFSDVARTILACGHKGDITDLAWSPDSAFLCSTSVDNTSVVWNVAKGEVAERRKDHTQYVQGAAWDPLNEYLVTEGNDRSCRVYALSGFDPVSRLSAKKVANKCVCVQTIKTREFPQQQPPPESTAATTSKAAEPQAQDAEPKTPSASATPTTATPAAAESAAAPKHRMFLDDTCPAFARRLTWTPDGSYLLAPTGTFRATEAAAAVHTVYAFARGNLSAPTLHLPGQEKASLGVRCSPVLYELRDGGRRNFFQAPQRSIFAVITLNTVVIYDTQQPQPICTLKDLHYADLTDASWSSDGQLLSISSMDGYLSFVQFADGFFGVPVARADIEAKTQQMMQRMFATPKLARKKHKAVAPSTAAGAVAGAAAAAADDEKPTGGAKKKTTVATLVARKKGDSAVATEPPAATPPGAVNTLQVRKKRKIAPVLVQPVVAPAPAPSLVSDVAPVSSARPGPVSGQDGAMDSDDGPSEPILL